LPVVLGATTVQELDVGAEMTALCPADTADNMVLKVYGDFVIANICILKGPSPAPKWLSGEGCIEEVGLVTADGGYVQGLVVPVQAANA